MIALGDCRQWSMVERVGNKKRFKKGWGLTMKLKKIKSIVELATPIL